MTIPQTDLAPQVMRLFYAAGLVSEGAYEAYGAANKRHKPILDVLTQPVSLDSFKDLLNAEITLKSSRRRDGESELHRELSATSIVHDDELMQLFAIHRRPVEALLAPLVADGLLAESESASLIARAGATPDYEWLVREGGINAGLVGRWLSSLKSSAMRTAALYLSIYFAQYNELIAVAEAQALLALLQSEARNEARRMLNETHAVTGERLALLLEDKFKLPQIQLDSIEGDPLLFGLFPQSMIRRLMFVPIHRNGTALGIATADPFSIANAAFLNWVTGLWPEPLFANGQALIARINEFYGTLTPPRIADAERRDLPLPLVAAPVKAPAGGAEAGGAEAETAGPIARPDEDAKPAGKRRAGARSPEPAAAPEPAAENSAKREAAQRRPRIETEIVADNVSAVQLVSSIIESAIEMRTTDIHIEPARDGLTVRFRIDGELHRIMTVPAALGQPVISRIKVLADMDVTERRRPQDGHFELGMSDHNFDFRISTLPAVLGEKLVIRILDTAQVKTSLEDLGLLPKQRQMVDWMLDRAHGMILVTGPTGSGKTSTLYAGLHRLNNENRNLVTIEDPVEYQLAGITQVQVDTHIGLTFSEGLRSILRQDPDVIMVGEIRDSDTARIAVRAATTGHLVLSTLHTNTALGAIDAMIHLGSIPFILANSIVGIISQRLVRKLCKACRKQQQLKAELAAQLGLPPESKKKIYRPVGCDECIGSGYLGRMGVFEVIRVIEQLRLQIATHQRQDILELTAREHDMPGLAQAGCEKVLQGETSAEEVIRKIMIDAG